MNCGDFSIADIFLDFLLQLLFTVGVVALFGFFIALCRRALYRCVGAPAYKALLVTGVIGTPIHELSHALMCLIFGHRITEIKLYQLNSKDGTLGYVNHTYNPRNLYCQIGNFFIGIAPILGGSGVLLLLMFLLTPDMFASVAETFRAATAFTSGAPDFGGYFALFGSVVRDIFAVENLKNALWWVFIVLAVMISSHMELSAADIRSSVVGLILFVVLLLAADFALGIFMPSALAAMTAGMLSFSAALGVFLAVSGCFCVLTVIIGFIVGLFRRR